MSDKKNIVIVGAGAHGISIGLVFALGGHETTIVAQGEEDPGLCQGMLDNHLETLLAADAVTQDAAGEAKERIRYTTDLASCAAQAGLVVEAATEDVQTKKSVFAELDRLCAADAVLASNTAEINLFACVEVSHPERLIIAHFCPPEHILPQVELVRGPHTADATVDALRTLLGELGKRTLVLDRFIPGYVVNRAGQAILREACYIVSQGWASAEDVDTAIMNTYGSRWPFEGPMLLRDFIGWDVALSASAHMIPLLCKSKEPLGPAVELAGKGWLGVKAGRGIKDYSGLDEAEVREQRNAKLLKMLKTANEIRNP